MQNIKAHTHIQILSRTFHSKATTMILFLLCLTNITGLENNFVYFEVWYEHTLGSSEHTYLP